MPCKVDANCSNSRTFAPVTQLSKKSLVSNHIQPVVSIRNRQFFTTAVLIYLTFSSQLSGAAELTTVGRLSNMVDACKINLKRDVVRTYWRDADGLIFGSMDRLSTALNRTGDKLTCASNAGIFGKDLHPIGLYMEDGQILRRLNTRKDGYGNFYLQPNGVFLISDAGAMILTTDEFQSLDGQSISNIRIATQSGPILMKSNQINPIFTPGSDNRLVRNAVCTSSRDELVLAKSRYPINFFDFANILREDLGCHDGLYLDGTISELFPFEGPLIKTNFGPIIGVIESAGRRQSQQKQ